ncbi:MAG: hypothetical protein IT462_06010 [Planctomycetes bacterium]|nr:hypothetical protein [Planctomycetota bacterium]
MRHLLPRAWAIAVLLVLAGASLAAQTNDFALTVSSVIHKPTAAEAGPYLVSNVAIGNGGKFDNDIPRITSKCLALAGVTTHDLLIVHNGSSKDLVFDGRRGQTTSPYLASSRPKYDNPGKPEGIMPGNSKQEVWGFDQSIVVPANSTVPLILFLTDWNPQLDTSPRDYVLTFGLWEVSQTPAQYTFEVELFIPGPSGGKGQTACVADPYGGMPVGVIIAAAAGLVAILPRRVKLLLRKA